MSFVGKGVPGFRPCDFAFDDSDFSIHDNGVRQFVRAASLSNYLEVAAQVGLDAAVQLKAAGIDRRALTDPDIRIPVDLVADLLERSAIASGCDSYGVRMAESRRLSDFGPISLLLAHQPTVRDSLLTMIEYRQLLNPSLFLQLEERGETAVITEQLLIDSPTYPRQGYELAIGVLYRLFRALLGARWRALSVNFQHGPPEDQRVHRRLFGPILQFNSDFNGVTCSRADLDNVNPTADPILARHAERYLRSLPNTGERAVAQEVRKAIYLLLPSAQASIRGVADSLGMTERTLQRRLTAEGGEFSQILNQVRTDLAPRYVEMDGVAFSRVAVLLGYSRQSSFNRWFAETFGMAPSAWRGRSRHPELR